MTEIAPIILALTQLIVAIGGVIAIIWGNYKTMAVKAVVEKVAIETNSMKDELVQEVRKAAFARGVLAEPGDIDPERGVPIKHETTKES